MTNFEMIKSLDEDGMANFLEVQIVFVSIVYMRENLVVIYVMKVPKGSKNGFIWR
ncbi:hypothetical protein Q0Y04_01880 [Clostridioides difficile]|nr:hypothetical protein Q0Y04_01880 [Clostridioides difficile]